MSNDKWKMENDRSPTHWPRPFRWGGARHRARRRLARLEEHNISIDAVAGASAGALIGGAYAAGLSISELEEMARKFRWRHTARFSFSRLGLQSNARMEDFLRARLPVTRFEELKPLHARTRR